jgi:hypothetical protein
MGMGVLVAPPFVDAQPLACNAADATKEWRVDLSGVTAGEERVHIIPDANGTLALVADVSAAISSHVAAADPHTGYVLESNVNDTIEAAIAQPPNATGGVVLYSGNGGVFSATSLAVNGATIGSNALAVLGQVQIGTGIGTSAGVIAGYAGTSGVGGIWSTAVTPGGFNGVTFNQFHTRIGAPNRVYIHGSSGAGPESAFGLTGETGLTINATVAALAAVTSDAVTNAITNVLTIGHNTSGTAAAGFGSSLKFQLESSTTADTDAVSLEAVWTTATHASRTSNLVFRVQSSASEATVTITPTGLTSSNGQLCLAGSSNSGVALAGTSLAAATLFVGAGGVKAVSMQSAAVFGWSSGMDGGFVASAAKSMANGVVWGGDSSVAAGSATTRNCVNKAVASIADNTTTTVFTVTIPNAAHSASIRVRLVGSSGAGGAIGANESTQEAEYLINITRTAGVNAVAAIGAVIGQPAAATVAGGNAVAVSGSISAISGAVGASNTFTIQVTIARAGGSATNHTCLAFAELLNANATGVTIA